MLRRILFQHDDVRLQPGAARQSSAPSHLLAYTNNADRFADPYDTTAPDDEWVNAIKNRSKSKGSFEQVAALAEAVTLGNIALRVPYKRLLWDASTMAFTNSDEANKFARREQYREGWEGIFSADVRSSSR